MAPRLHLLDADAPRVHASLADFEPQHESELRMRMGNVLIVHGERGGWSLASILGGPAMDRDPASGLVPSDHLQPAISARAISDFAPVEAHELRLFAGEQVWMLQALVHTPDGWVQVVNNAGDVGIAPRSFLVLLGTPGSTSASPHRPTDSGESTGTGASSICSSDRWPSTPPSSAIGRDRKTSPAQRNNDGFSSLHHGQPAGYLSAVLYDFEAQATGEVSLRAGEQVSLGSL